MTRIGGGGCPSVEFRPPAASRTRARLEEPREGMSSKLYEDSLKLTVNKNLQDIRLLLIWAEEASGIQEKIQHSEQAVHLLSEIILNLKELDRR